MLIKSADDKSKRIALLQELQKSPLLSRSQQDWLREELFRLTRGIQGERDAAHYLDNYLRDDPERALLHDLRISIDGETAQIDHLLMTRGMHVYLLETKNFGGNVHINAHGEFSVEYSGERVFGIESPIEQSRRHERAMSKLFERLEIRGRTGGAPKIHHCVLVHPKATIRRPDPKAMDTSMVMKADQFRSWHEKFMERSIGVTEAVGTLLNMRSADTLKSLAEKLARQHRPANLLALPDFMQPTVQPVILPVSPPAVLAKNAPPSLPTNSQARKEQVTAQERKRLICATCGTRITYAEGKFCWNNDKRFAGLQYCREHQAAF
jgi:hypothetical protein